MNNLFNYCKSVAEKRKIWLIILALAYNLGVIFGIIFFNSSERVLFVDNSVDFMLLALSKDGSAVSLLFSRIGNLIALTVVFVFTGLSVFVLYPTHILIVLYRGYVLGVAMVVFLFNFGVTGAVLFVFAVFIQNIITTLALIFLSTLSLNEGKCHTKGKPLNTKRYILYSIGCILIALIGILFEFFMLIAVLRPLNFYF